MQVSIATFRNILWSYKLTKAIQTQASFLETYNVRLVNKSQAHNLMTTKAATLGSSFVVKSANHNNLIQVPFDHVNQPIPP